jgi:uncharacterized protein YggE
VSAGGEPARTDGLRFEISDPTEAQVEAREAAWADAVTRATHWAALSGRRLGEVVWLQEGGSDAVPVFRAKGGVAAATSIPVEVGVQPVTCAVTVRWAWADDVASASA